MLFELLPALGGSAVIASFVGIVWGFLAFALVLICLLLIGIILIQDPKGGGLASAFGGGSGSESLLGARAQKDVTTWTGWLTLFFLCIAFLMVIIDPDRTSSAGDVGAGAAPTSIQGAPDAGAGGAAPPPGLPLPPFPGESPGPGAGSTTPGTTPGATPGTTPPAGNGGAATPLPLPPPLPAPAPVTPPPSDQD